MNSRGRSSDDVHQRRDLRPRRVVIVLGVNYRYVDGTITSAGYAWTGFTAALLALANPLYTVFAGVFLAALDVGAAGMERRTSIPLQVVDIVKAAIILMIAIRVGRSDRGVRCASGRGRLMDTSSRSSTSRSSSRRSGSCRRSCSRPSAACSPSGPASSTSPSRA